MFSDAFRCFPMLSNISRSFPMPFRSPGRRGTSKQMKCFFGGHYFLSDAFPMSFRCLSDVFPMSFRCLSDVFPMLLMAFRMFAVRFPMFPMFFLLSLKVRCFSCFECLTVKTCKGRDAMFSTDTGAGFISEKKLWVCSDFFANSWNSFFSA